jgi:hypothetical protein
MNPKAVLSIRTVAQKVPGASRQLQHVEGIKLSSMAVKSDRMLAGVLKVVGRILLQYVTFNTPITILDIIYCPVFYLKLN